MAAGPVVFYQHALEDIVRGNLDLQSATIVLSLLSQGYTPNAKSHSVYSADASANVITASGYADRTLANKTVAKTSGSYVTWDADDITLSAAATMRTKWLVGYLGSGTKRLVFYMDTETTQTTGVEVTQLVVQWNALGLAQFNNPSA
jgi:hypothetical protein